MQFLYTMYSFHKNIKNYFNFSLVFQQAVHKSEKNNTCSCIDTKNKSLVSCWNMKQQYTDRCNMNETTVLAWFRLGMWKLKRYKERRRQRGNVPYIIKRNRHIHF